jgi:hypothetical protein
VKALEPSLASSLAGINFSSNVWVISIQIKYARKTSFNKTVGLKDAWEEKVRKKVIY